jgi:hypothetical protein
MKRAMILAALILLGLAVAKSFGAMDRSHHQRDAFSWHDAVPDDGWIRVRNINGSIQIAESENDSVFVRASTSWKGTPEKVSFIVNQDGGDVYICAIHGGGDERDCAADTYRNRRRSWLARQFWKARPVSVEFTVYAPAKARIDAQTSNGSIKADAPLVALVADTRNGRIDASKPVQSIKANTYNGRINAVIADGALASDVVLETRNGSVTVELPENLSGELSYQTRHGSITNDFATVPMTVGHRSGQHSGSFTLGQGGPRLSFSTRNGDIKISKRPVKTAADSAVVAATK